MVLFIRLCFLIEFWLTSAASRQNSSEQNVLRCKPGADTQCWLLGVNFFGIKGNVKTFPQFCVLAVLILVMTYFRLTVRRQIYFSENTQAFNRR